MSNVGPHLIVANPKSKPQEKGKATTKVKKPAPKEATVEDCPSKSGNASRTAQRVAPQAALRSICRPP
ncbi:hypothetical protein F444_17486 [Phytophthora nicotianae P1976]|uniref:Uncharacterized protein n=1 Tax=Phytophthora nicotianae P1976 TaxID=1317066 RepID=A0A080ZEV0_PHYNI|nr:hypothetical protein F444_17486 [Phytophthora nicotianae P1976]